MSEITLEIERLGAGGDGVATGPDGRPLFVALTLPGEIVVVEEPQGDNLQKRRAALKRIITPSPHRVKPPCPHFRQCGGCSLQHFAPAAYGEWKRRQLENSLAKRGLQVDVRPLAGRPSARRRRAAFSATRSRKGVLLGYFKRAAHTIVDIRQCPVLEPSLVDALPALRRLVRPLLSRKSVARLSVLVTAGGLDIVIGNVEPVEDGDRRLELARLSEALQVARLTVAGEILLEREKALVHFDGLAAISPPGSFLQPSVEMQDMMIAHVGQLTAGIEGGRALDLFSGMGTFTLPLARRFNMLAVEHNGAALAALRQASGFSTGLKTIETLERDLATMPLSNMELRGYDLALIDPPRSGARAQIGELARSHIARLVAVSCNPASFARDARQLMDGGYCLQSVTPFDQFSYSPHVELVAEFVKAS